MMVRATHGIFHITALRDYDERSEYALSTSMDASILSQAVCLAWIESALPMNGVEIRLLKCNGEKEKWRGSATARPFIRARCRYR